MARNPKVGKKTSQGRRPKPGAGGGRPRGGRPKFCIFCREHVTWVDYKDIDVLRRFVSDRGRIKARGTTGTCAQHQRDVATAVKTARELALMPYAVRTAAGDARGGRGGFRRGGRPSGEDRAEASEDSPNEAEVADGSDQPETEDTEDTAAPTA